MEREVGEVHPLRSTIQSAGYRTSERIAGNPRLRVRFAITDGTREGLLLR